ncbi:disks large homolog 5-like [Suricata suricatta]|uniref:disks large homolog 5-like n=1 Tax=Suricata suricatta TaxID=37032 RepID=UPI0011556499|nr:disks large homolog 5-like [Suricata suricatta]
MFDTAMYQLEVVKKDYDALRERYSEEVAIHPSDLSRLEQLEEENQRLLKQTELLTQQRDTAIQLQHQCALSLRRCEAIHQEVDKATAQNNGLQWEMELLQSELTELRTIQLKTAKESEQYKEERDTVYSEYMLIKSQLDQVISELDRLDKLQTDVELAESKLKSSTSQKKAASEEMEALGQVGSRDVRGKTVEEVYEEMLKPNDDVRLKVQNRPEFTKVKGLPGDSFYIRALYDRLAEVEHELSFKKDVTSSTLMTLCLRAHLGPGWPGSLTRTPRRSSAGRSPANT